MTEPRRVLLLGATGLVGRECLRRLLADRTVVGVTVLARRAPPPELSSAVGEERVRWQVADFERLAAYASCFGVDQLICALGTTMRQAGSKARFRRVDLDYPLEAAELARAAGARHLLLVSALGASRRSPIFYNRIKGELEAAVLALPFRSVTIARPSVLLGRRTDRRLGESIAQRLGFLAPARYRPIQASVVASVLVRAARIDLPGPRILESEALQSVADGP